MANGTITLSILDDRSMPADMLDHMRMQTEQVLVSEHVRRLVRQLEGATGLRWEASQSPRPVGSAQPTQREIIAAQRQRAKETEAFFKAREQLRARSAADREAAVQRLAARGTTTPTPMQIMDELQRKPAPVSETAGRRGDPLSTDAAVRKILRRADAAEI